MSPNYWLRTAIARIEATTSGYLDQVGWFRTRVARVAMDRTGRPMPWFTYPAVAFLEDRVQPHWRVLEFGSGMGTLWWSKRVAKVVAVEHDTDWARRISSKCSARVLEVGIDDAEAYANAAAKEASFDVVVVDGIFRAECLARAPGALGPGGIIILDDAQRTEYSPGTDTLRSLGYRSIAFHGPQPVSKHPGCTEIFYRDDNVLGL